MAHIGHPILGDSLYNVDSAGNEQWGRLCLHALEIVFHHPQTDAEIVVRDDIN